MRPLPSEKVGGDGGPDRQPSATTLVQLTELTQAQSVKEAHGLVIASCSRDCIKPTDF